VDDFLKKDHRAIGVDLAAVLMAYSPIDVKMKCPSMETVDARIRAKTASIKRFQLKNWDTTLLVKRAMRIFPIITIIIIYIKIKLGACPHLTGRG
jgi:hypothetical protein